MLTKTDLKAIDGIVVKRVKPVANKLNKLEKLVHMAISFLDKDTSNLKKRVEKIEWRLGPSL